MAVADMLQDFSSTAAHGRSPLQIVVMLYDNALASMKASKAAIAAGDSHRRDFQLNRSEQIVTALMHCLDSRSGEMAADLKTLYCYVLNELSEAHQDTTTARIDRCESVLKDLRNVWLELEAAITPPSGFGRSIAA